MKTDLSGGLMCNEDDRVLPLFEFEILRVGEGDALGCTRCGTSRLGSYVSAAELVTNGLARGRNISIQGREPLLHPELPQLIDTLVRDGVDRLHLVTDGMGLAHREVAAGVSGSGVSWVSVRLLAADAATHDALIGISGSFEMVSSGLDIFAQAVEVQGSRMLLTGEVPACSHNVEALPATVAFLADKGARSVSVDVSRLPRSPQARAWVESALDTGLASGVWVYLSDPSFVDSPEGSLIACSPVRFVEVGADG